MNRLLFKIASPTLSVPSGRHPFLSHKICLPENQLVQPPTLNFIRQTLYDQLQATSVRIPGRSACQQVFSTLSMHSPKHDPNTCPIIFAMCQASTQEEAPCQIGDQASQLNSGQDAAHRSGLFFQCPLLPDMMPNPHFLPHPSPASQTENPWLLQAKQAGRLERK